MIEANVFIDQINGTRRILVVKNSDDTNAYTLNIEDLSRNGQILSIDIEQKSMLTIIWNSRDNDNDHNYSIRRQFATFNLTLFMIGLVVYSFWL